MATTKQHDARCLQLEGCRWVPGGLFNHDPRCVYRDAAIHRAGEPADALEIGKCAIHGNTVRTDRGECSVCCHELDASDTPAAVEADTLPTPSERDEGSEVMVRDLDIDIDLPSDPQDVPAERGTLADGIRRHREYYENLAASGNLSPEDEAQLRHALAQDAAPELQPCPFDGADAVHRRTSIVSTLAPEFDAFWVECSVCEVGTKYHDAPSKAAKTWNTRSADAETAKSREALRGLGRDKQNVNTGIRRLCWCSNVNVCVNEPECTAARAALQTGESENWLRNPIE